MRKRIGLHGHPKRNDRDDRDLRGKAHTRGLPRRRAPAVDDPRERGGDDASEQVELGGEAEQQSSAQDAAPLGRPGVHPLAEGRRIDRSVRTAQEERPDQGEHRAEDSFGDDDNPIWP